VGIEVTLGLCNDQAGSAQYFSEVQRNIARGKSGITTLLPCLPGDDAGLISIVSGKGSAYMTFFRSVFERRAPKSIPAVEAALGTELKQGNSTHQFAQSLMDALTLAHREAVDNHHVDQSAD
jgi:hypothetical protein